MFGRKQLQAAPAAKKVGVLGVLTGVAGTAFGLIQPKFGVGSIARWAATKAFASRQPKATTSSAPRPSSKASPQRASATTRYR
jgi:hypothetical protein